VNRAQAGATCWQHGRIWPMLDPHMRDVYWRFRRCTARKFVFDCARKFGKSTIMIACAFEDAMQIDKAEIKYGAATQDAVVDILMPLVEYILDGRGDRALSCPDQWRPEWVARRHGYRFPRRTLAKNALSLLEACKVLGCTEEEIAFERERMESEPANDNGILFTGSEPLTRANKRSAKPAKKVLDGSLVKLVGCDLHPNRLRGPVMHTGYLDEAAFITKLEYVVQSVLWHMMQGMPNSRILMGSTPPESPGHSWTTRYVVEAKANDAYVHRTIRDNTKLTEEQIEGEIKEAGGPLHSNCRRELFAQHVIDETLAVVPEFEEAKPFIVKAHPRPSHFDWYVSMDPAFTDLTAILFGFWDFREQLLVIEDEALLEQPNTQDIADAIKEGEQSYDHGPHMRISDVDLRLISDLWTQHGLTVIATQKDDKDTAVANLRLMIQQHKIRIHPRCKGLIAHLEHAVWKKSRKTFERSGDHGHFDAVDALVYLVRNVNKSRNPFPKYLHGESALTHKMPHNDNGRARTREGAVVLDLFRPKRRSA